jgi:hypothetical protein
VILRSTGGCIDAHSDDTAEQDVACEAGTTASGYFLGQRNDLGIVTLFADRDRYIRVPLRLDDARRQALRWNIQSRDIGLRTGWCRSDRNILGCSARN